jgi:hypothetical protein
MGWLRIAGYRICKGKIKKRNGEEMQNKTAKQRSQALRIPFFKIIMLGKDTLWYLQKFLSTSNISIHGRS